MSAKWENIGPLSCLVAGEPDAKKAVILFHGYGADASDLAPFAGMIPTPNPVRWIFPNGLLTVPIGMMMEGRAWFSIDMAALEEAMLKGTHRDLTGFDSPEIKKVRQAATEMLAAIGLPPEDIVLGGFSQGAMLATDLTLSMQDKPTGLAILSGALIAESRWQKLLAGGSPVAFFQSHGEADPLLDPEGARRLHALLLKSGWRGEYMEFRGGHEIPPMALMKLSSFIAERLR